MDSATTQTFNELALEALNGSNTSTIELARNAIQEAKAIDFSQAAHFLRDKAPSENVLGELELPEKILCLAAINLLRQHNRDTGPHSYDLVTASRLIKDALRRKIIDRLSLTDQANFEIEFRKGWIAVKHGRLFDHI